MTDAVPPIQRVEKVSLGFESSAKLAEIADFNISQEDGSPRSAGLMGGMGSPFSFVNSGRVYSDFRGSYTDGSNYTSGVNDIPDFFRLMNEQNGGSIRWPVDLKEKYSWYRYFARCFTNNDVLVTLWDGTQRRLGDLSVGDELVNAFGEKTKVKELNSKHHEGFVYRFQAEGMNYDNLEVTEEHPFYILDSENARRILDQENQAGEKQKRNTANNIDFSPKWKLASEIKEGDCFVAPCKKGDECNQDGNSLIPIRKIEKREFSGKIFNLSTDGKTYNEKTFLVYGVATHNTDAYVGRAVDLLCDLPLSKLSLSMPRMEGQSAELKEEVYDFYKFQIENLRLFKRFQEILWEVTILGNAFVFCEFDEENLRWEKLSVLPPEEVSVYHYPFSDDVRFEYCPGQLVKMISSYDESVAASDPLKKEVYENTPKEIRDQIKRYGAIVMDSDPQTGSFCYHFTKRKHSYFDLGASELERITVAMILKEHYRYTQLSLASRNMTPRNKITAPDLHPSELEELRAQVDEANSNPDFSVVTNYEWNWDMIGADGRLLNLDSEYERLDQQIFAGLGMTREFLTGEGSYSGNRITVEILNTLFLQSREMLQEFVEQYLFKPIAEKRGWFEQKKNGVKKYFYPKLSFNRMSLRDNQEVFDALFSLYQKGSLPIDTIYELFNLDPETTHEKLKEQLFTIKDATFNRVVEAVNEEAGRALAERSDAVDKIADYLGLVLKEKPSEDEGFGEEGMGDMGFGESDEESFSQDETPSEEVFSEEEPNQEVPPKEGMSVDEMLEGIVEKTEKVVPDGEPPLKDANGTAKVLGTVGRKAVIKDKDLTSDNLGVSKKPSSGAKIKPPRDDCRSPQRSRNLSPEERKKNNDVDVQGDPDKRKD